MAMGERGNPNEWEPDFIVDQAGLDFGEFIVLDCEGEHVCECRSEAAANMVARALSRLSLRDWASLQATPPAPEAGDG